MLDLRAIEGFSGSPVVDAKSGQVLAVMIGMPKDDPNTDFSLAATVRPEDLLNRQQSAAPLRDP